MEYQTLCLKLNLHGNLVDNSRIFSTIHIYVIVEKFDVSYKCFQRSKLMGNLYFSTGFTII